MHYSTEALMLGAQAQEAEKASAGRRLSMVGDEVENLGNFLLLSAGVIALWMIFRRG